MSTTSECRGCRILAKAIVTLEELIEDKEDHINSLNEEISDLAEKENILDSLNEETENLS